MSAVPVDSYPQNILYHTYTKGSRPKLLKNTDGVEFVFAVVSTEPVVTETLHILIATARNNPVEFAHSVIHTKSSFTIDAGMELSGLMLYDFVRFINSRHTNLAGVWSNILMVRVP